MINNISANNLKKVFSVTLTAILLVSGFFVGDVLAVASITVTSPTAGVYWRGTQNITWIADCQPGDQVNIYYSTNDFVSSTKIADGVACNAYSYSWDTTGKNGANYKIKVRDKIDPDVSGVSDVFTIDNVNPTIQITTLVSPNGGEFWAGGSSKNITWTAGDITDINLEANPISLSYTTDGATWNPIAGGEANDGSYSWAVPEIDFSTVKVKIVATDLAGNTASDESNAIFTIDSTHPIATVITSVNPIFEGALIQTVTVTYDEAMNPATSPVITLTGTNWGAQTPAGWTVGNTVYTATFTHDGTQESISAAVATVANASGATDLAANSEIGDDSSAFVVDTQKATVIGVTPTALVEANVGSVSVVVTFNENMD